MFKRLMTPEEQREFESTKARIAERKAKLATLTDTELADELEYCLVNSSFCAAGKKLQLTTYDDAMVRVHLPEVLRRLRGHEEKPNNYHELKRRFIKQSERAIFRAGVLDGKRG